MKTLKLLAMLMICAGSLAQAQTNLTAKTALPAALAKAKAEYSQDAVLDNILFVNTNYAGVAMSMDITNGQTSGWAYSFYSASHDSTVICLVINLPFPLGQQMILSPGSGVISQGEAFFELAEPFLDSPQVLQLLREGGAKDFLTAHPGAVVNVAVASYAGTGYQQMPAGKYWVFMFGSQTDSLTCIIDAVTGTSVLCGALTSLEGIPVATGMRLDQNYPNPVSMGAASTSVIRYAVADRRAVRLAVFDCLGRELAVLQSGVVDAGEHIVTLPAGVIRQPGVFFYRLETTSGIVTRKFVVSE